MTDLDRTRSLLRLLAWERALLEPLAGNFLAAAEFDEPEDADFEDGFEDEDEDEDWI